MPDFPPQNLRWELSTSTRTDVPLPKYKESPASREGPWMEKLIKAGAEPDTAPALLGRGLCGARFKVKRHRRATSRN